MTSDEMLKRIEELEEQMRELEPKRKKVSSILRMAIPGGISLFCLLAFFYSLLLYLLEDDFLDTDGFIVPMIIFGVLFLVGVVVCLSGIPQMKRMKTINDEYNKLEDEKKSLEKRLKLIAKTGISESNDDTLLRLLSENKITLEEYKSLSKKK